MTSTRPNASSLFRTEQRFRTRDDYRAPIVASSGSRVCRKWFVLHVLHDFFEFRTECLVQAEAAHSIRTRDSAAVAAKYDYLLVFVHAWQCNSLRQDCVLKMIILRHVRSLPVPVEGQLDVVRLPRNELESGQATPTSLMDDGASKLVSQINSPAPPVLDGGAASSVQHEGKPC